MIDLKDGSINCPICNQPVDLSAYKVVVEKSEHSPTVDIVSVLAQDGSVARIDLKKEPRHTVNCDFTLFRAPCQVLG